MLCTGWSVGACARHRQTDKGQVSVRRRSPRFLFTSGVLMLHTRCFPPQGTHRGWRFFQHFKSAHNSSKSLQLAAGERAAPDREGEGVIGLCLCGWWARSGDRGSVRHFSPSTLCAFCSREGQTVAAVVLLFQTFLESFPPHLRHRFPPHLADSKCRSQSVVNRTVAPWVVGAESCAFRLQWSLARWLTAPRVRPLAHWRPEH